MIAVAWKDREMTEMERHVLKLGSHMSTSGGGPHMALRRAAEQRMQACQLFTKNERQWNAKPLTEEQITLFHEELENGPIKAEHVVAHDSYLINIASPDDEMWEKSRLALLLELERCDQLGIPYLVSHPGAHVKSGVEAGVARVIEAINRINDERPDGKCTLLIETTAGQGTTLGRSFEEIAQMLDGVEDKSRVAVCFDTCHVFAAGYDIRTPEAYAETMKHFDEVIGINQIKALHLNDSKFGLGSHKDRHAMIGEGEIGLEGFRAVMNDARLTCRPAVLETEKDAAGLNDARNIATLRSLIETPSHVEASA